MNLQEFKSTYEAEKNIFLAWGELVASEITKKLREKLGSQTKLATFLRIPPSPRVKTIDSLICKAYYRGKQYRNPYTEITDKVGVRFVVLLLKDILLVQNIIESSSIWSYSKDRDFEEERLKNPLSFDYQSVHYILTSNIETNSNAIKIPVGFTCEVQIRTLLQHAYSELTHDTIYKPKTKSTPQVKRAVSKSMALIETTDNIFSDVDETLNEISKNTTNYLNNITDIYTDLVGVKDDINEKTNNLILETYQDLINNYNLSELSSFLNSKPYLKEKIKLHTKDNLLFKQPIILVIYFLVSKNKYNVKQLWPLQTNDLKVVYVDLGISF